MFARIRKEWRAFIGDEPGQRFLRLHERQRRTGSGLVQKVFWCVAGIVLLAAGVVMLVTPGPGLLAIAFGLACLAHESAAFARRCDRWELSLRRAWRRHRKP